MITNVPLKVVNAMADLHEFCKKNTICECCPLFREHGKKGCYLNFKVPVEWEFRVVQVKIGEVGDTE